MRLPRELGVLHQRAAQHAHGRASSAGSPRRPRPAAPDCARSFSRSCGCSISASTPREIALRVVSLPASSTNCTNESRSSFEKPSNDASPLQSSRPLCARRARPSRSGRRAAPRGAPARRRAGAARDAPGSPGTRASRHREGPCVATVVAPAAEELEVRAVEPEHVGDDAHRHGRGELGDELAAAARRRPRRWRRRSSPRALAASRSTMRGVKPRLTSARCARCAAPSIACIEKRASNRCQGPFGSDE